MSRIDWASEDAARLAQHEIDGAREGLAPRLECNDPARVVVLSDQREPRDSCSAPPPCSARRLDNGCRVEFDLPHSKQRFGVTSTRQYSKAFHEQPEQSRHPGIWR